MDKLLTQEEINSLVVAAKNGNDDAGNQLFLQFRRFLYLKARPFIGVASEEDVIQMASYGFAKAIRDFEPEKGFHFITFLAYKIKGQIQNDLRDSSDKSRGVSYPRRIKELSSKIVKLSLVAGTNVEQEIEQSDLSIEEKVEVLSYLTSTISFDKEVISDDGRATVRDFYGTSEENFAMVELEQTILSSLTDKEKDFYFKRLRQDMTQNEIAKEYGIKQTHVSRREVKLKNKIMEVLENV